MLNRLISFNDILRYQYGIIDYSDECHISKKILCDTDVRHDDWLSDVAFFHVWQIVRHVENALENTDENQKVLLCFWM